VNVSHILATLPVGLERLTRGTWSVFSGPIRLGWPDDGTSAFTTAATNVTGHLSGDTTCYLPGETLTGAALAGRPSAGRG
jgi:hypothetical protein